METGKTGAEKEIIKWNLKLLIKIEPAKEIIKWNLKLMIKIKPVKRRKIEPVKIRKIEPVKRIKIEPVKRRKILQNCFLTLDLCKIETYTDVKNDGNILTSSKVCQSEDAWSFPVRVLTREIEDRRLLSTRYRKSVSRKCLPSQIIWYAH